jgi:tetratricopeptide (TPR) repeat protein
MSVEAWVFERDANARTESARATFEEQIAEADLFIGIFWKRCGRYTIEEHEHAARLGKPRHIYEKYTELEDRDPSLRAFLGPLSDVDAGVTVRRFATAEELGERVKEDLMAWVARTVRRAAAPLVRELFQAPPPTQHAVERAGVMGRLKDALLATDDRPVGRAAIHGIGGVGKSTAAAAFAHLEETRARFRDGVLWVTLGQSPNIAQRLSDWGRALGDLEGTSGGYADAQAGTQQLRALLRERACLLIVDDAWTAEHVRPFLVGGPRCLLLMTTRQRDAAEGVAATIFGLEEMTPDEGRALVENWAGPIAAEDREIASSLMRGVGYLPLALELIAAQAGKVGWTEYARLREAKLNSAIKRGRSSRGKEDNLRDSIELSVETLVTEDRARYLLLGVFAEDVAFPVGACGALWRCSDADAAELLIDFAGRALVRERGAHRYVLHDVLYDELIERLGNEGRRRAHESLLDGYRARCPGGAWHEGPDDGYFFDHLAGHFAAAGRVEDLFRLIDQPWMERQFARARSDHAFGADVDVAIAAAVAGGSSRLFELIRCTYICASLGTRATRFEPSALGALSRLGQVERAAGQAALIHDPARRCEAFRLIGLAVFARGLVEEARGFLARARGAILEIELLTSRIDHWAELASACLAVGDKDGARGAAEQLEIIAKRTNAFKAHAFICAASAWLAIGSNNDRVERCLAEAEASLVEEGDLVAECAYIIRCRALYERVGAHEASARAKAREVELLAAVEEKLDWADRSDQIVASLLEAGELEDATAHAERSSWDQQRSLAAVATAFAAAGAEKKAMAIAERATQNLVPFVWDYGRSFVALASLWARIRGADAAIELSKSVPDSSVTSRALAGVANVLAERGDETKALRAVELSLSFARPTGGSGGEKGLWLVAAAGGLRSKHLVEAISIESRLPREIVSSNRDDVHRWAKQVVEAAASLSKAGNRGAAREVTEHLSSSWAKADALVALIAGWCDDRVKARELASAAVVLRSDDAEVFGAAGRALAEIGCSADACELADKTLAMCAEASNRRDASPAALANASRAYAYGERFIEAKAAIEMILRDGDPHPEWRAAEKVDALVFLAERQRASELMTEATAVSSQTGPHLARSLLDLARGWRALERADEAARAARAALKLTRRELDEIDDTRWLPFVVLDHVVPHAIRAAAMLGEELEILEVIMRVAVRKLGFGDRAKILGMTARMFAEIGRKAEAIVPLCAALEGARKTGRPAVLLVLKDGAEALAAIDDGELLLKIVREVDEVDRWLVV